MTAISRTKSICLATLFAMLLLSVEFSAQQVRRITYNNINVDVVIDKPANPIVDVIVAFHGTVMSDTQILAAAQNTLTRVREITDRNDMMIVSVAYPQEGRLMGEGIREAEAALLWVKEKSRKVLKKKVRRIYLVGHSQGGYVVTRLNTMHATDGVIANAPGPLNLVLRCGLEETGQIGQSAVCLLMRQTYGTTTQNPDAYMARSLLNFTSGHRAPILFVQGLQDAQIQLASWPAFKQQMTDCTTCQSRQFVEIANGGHTALFDSPEAQAAYNAFIGN